MREMCDSGGRLVSCVAEHYESLSLMVTIYRLEGEYMTACQDCLMAQVLQAVVNSIVCIGNDIGNNGE